MPIKLKRSDIKDKIDNPAEGYMILGFDEKGTLVWKDEDGNYGNIVPPQDVGQYEILQIKNYLTIGYRDAGAQTGLYSIAHGDTVAAAGLASFAQGQDAEANGNISTAKGLNVLASGDYSYVGGQATLIGTKLTSGGQNSFVYSYTDYSVSGTWSDYSVILGGQKHNIGDDSPNNYSSNNSFILGGDTSYIGYRSHNSGIIGGNNNEIVNDVENTVIVGGNFINATTDNAVYVPRLIFPSGKTYNNPPAGDGTIEYKINPATGKYEFYSFTESNPDGSLMAGVYMSTLTPITMHVKTGGVGGITDSESVGSLTGKSYTELFDKLLFPTQYPTYTLPTISLTGIAGGIFEVGFNYTATISVYGIKNDAGAYTQLRVLRNGSAISTQTSFTTTSESDIAPQYGYTDPNNPNTRYTITYSESFPLPLGTTSWSGDGNYGAGYPKKDNTNHDDVRPAAVRTTTAPQAAGTNFTSTASSVTAQNRAYWGINAGTSITGAVVSAFSSLDFATGYARTITYANGNSQYLYYCYPSRFGGTPIFTYGGLPTTFILQGTNISVTNSSGYTENFTVWRSLNTQSATSMSIIVT